MTGILASSFVEERRGYLTGTVDRRSPFRPPLWLALVPVIALAVWVAPIWHPNRAHSTIVVSGFGAPSSRDATVKLEIPSIIDCSGLGPCHPIAAVDGITLTRPGAHAVAWSDQLKVRLPVGRWWLTVESPLLSCPYRTPVDIPMRSRVVVRVNCSPLHSFRHLPDSTYVG